MRSGSAPRSAGPGTPAGGGAPGANLPQLIRSAGHSNASASGLLDAASHEYDRRASRAQLQATVGSGVVILLLLAAFGLLYRRAARALGLAERLAVENAHPLTLSREEALNDSLTGLPNRRALINDLSAALPQATDDAPLVLGLFDRRTTTSFPLLVVRA